MTRVQRRPTSAHAFPRIRGLVRSIACSSPINFLHCQAIQNASVPYEMNCLIGFAHNPRSLSRMQLFQPRSRKQLWIYIDSANSQEYVHPVIFKTKPQKYSLRRKSNDTHFRASNAVSNIFVHLASLHRVLSKVENVRLLLFSSPQVVLSSAGHSQQLADSAGICGHTDVLGDAHRRT